MCVCACVCLFVFVFEAPQSGNKTSVVVPKLRALGCCSPQTRRGETVFSSSGHLFHCFPIVHNLHWLQLRLLRKQNKTKQKYFCWPKYIGCFDTGYFFPSFNPFAAVINTKFSSIQIIFRPLSPMAANQSANSVWIGMWPVLETKSKSIVDLHVIFQLYLKTNAAVKWSFRHFWTNSICVKVAFCIVAPQRPLIVTYSVPLLIHPRSCNPSHLWPPCPRSPRGCSFVRPGQSGIVIRWQWRERPRWKLDTVCKAVVLW